MDTGNNTIALCGELIYTGEGKVSPCLNDKTTCILHNDLARRDHFMKVNQEAIQAKVCPTDPAELEACEGCQ